MIRKLNFNPALHGLHFNNNFTNHVGAITTRGLCGGMSLAAFSYYRLGWPVPTHMNGVSNFGTPDDMPPEGSRLRSMIYNLQIGSFATAFPFLYLDPDLNHHFDWSVSTFPSIVRAINANKFLLLGLRSGFAAGHQVLVYGYDDATRKIFIYDCNYPDEEITIELDAVTRRLKHSRANGTPSGNSYLSYFIQLELDPNVRDLFTDVNRPSYTDSALVAGISVTGVVPADRRIGQLLTYTARVRNFGEFASLQRSFQVYVRDPNSANRDATYGTVLTVPRLMPGQEVILTRSIPAFADIPGVWEIGVTYTSMQNQVIPLAQYAVPGTANKTFVNVLPALTTPSPSWFSIGTDVASDPVVCKNQDNRLEVFVRKTDNRIYRLFQRTANIPNDCSPLELLPGDVRFDGNISAIRNQSEHLEIFARGRDGALWHRWQTRPNATLLSEWTNWTSRGGSMKSDPEVAMNQDRRLEVFFIGTDDRIHKIYHRLFGGFWSGFEVLDAPTRFKGSISSVTDSLGRINLVARGFDDAVWHNFQTAPNGPYAGWRSMGGVVSGSPVLAKNEDGRLEAVVQGTDGRIWHQWQGTPGGAWSGTWILLQPGATPPVLRPNLRPSIAYAPTGMIELGATASAFNVAYIGRIPSSPYWSQWTNRSGLITSNTAIGTNPNGTIELFGVSSTGSLMHHWFTRS